MRFGSIAPMHKFNSQFRLNFIQANAMKWEIVLSEKKLPPDSRRMHRYEEVQFVFFFFCLFVGSRKFKLFANIIIIMMTDFVSFRSLVVDTHNQGWCVNNNSTVVGSYFFFLNEHLIAITLNENTSWLWCSEE